MKVQTQHRFVTLSSESTRLEGHFISCFIKTKRAEGPATETAAGDEQINTTEKQTQTEKLQCQDRTADANTDDNANVNAEANANTDANTDANVANAVESRSWKQEE